MNACLITGGAGFIGSNFVNHLLHTYQNELRLIVLDKLTYAGNLENLRDVWNQIDFIQGDICDRRLVQSLFHSRTITSVVNFAAESHVDRSIENSDPFIRTNILGTQVLLESSRRAWEAVPAAPCADRRRFLQVSTDEVYGSLSCDACSRETSPLRPRSPYSASKASADLLVQAYVATYGYPALITRCSNNYGPFQFPEKLIPLIIKNALQGIPIPLYGNGENTREWLHVADHCRAIELILREGRPGHVYNIGSGEEKQNIEVVKSIIDRLSCLSRNGSCQALLSKSKNNRFDYGLIEHVRDRKGHDSRYSLNCSKIREELGWAPQTRFDQGLDATIQWYLENQEWLQRLPAAAASLPLQVSGPETL